MKYHISKQLLYFVQVTLFGVVLGLLIQHLEKIAVIGIGGLGHLVIQYSKAAGFHTTAITHSKDKEELASKLGADSVVDSRDALKQSEGGGADIILVQVIHIKQ
jgi:D-arabinose 1-dehydrogenase-like Zn-dependent alcohol dehydrogenase